MAGALITAMRLRSSLPTSGARLDPRKRPANVAPSGRVPVAERLPATARPRRPWVTALAAILPSPIGHPLAGGVCLAH